MKRVYGVLAVAIVAATAVWAATVLTVDDVLKGAAKYDTKEVTVKGVIDKFEAKTSKAGNKYTVLTLKGTKESLNAYTRGHIDPAPKKGDTVEITGIFRKEKKVTATYTVKNEVDFTKVEKKKYGLKIVKKG